MSKRRKALYTMPTRLETAFASTIKRIQNQQHERAVQAMDVLKSVFLAKKQLSVSELRHALAVNATPQDTISSGETLDWENLPSEKSLVDWCLGLVIVDEETSTVRLVHKSLYEYLLGQYKKNEIFRNGDAEIAHTCLKYMLFNDAEKFELIIGLTVGENQDPHLIEFNPINTINNLRLQKFSLLHYAIYSWGHHLRRNTTPAVDAIPSISCNVNSSPPVSRRFSSIYHCVIAPLTLQKTCWRFIRIYRSACTLLFILVWKHL